MKYMLLIYADENAWTEAERQECYVESTQLAHNLKANGQFVSTSPLQPVATATCVKVRDSKRLVTDGPFAETREQLGGYFMVRGQEVDRRGHRHWPEGSVRAQRRRPDRNPAVVRAGRSHSQPRR